MTQTDQETETRCVYSSLSPQLKSFDEKSHDSIETLTNPDTALQESMYDHSPQPTFDDWSRQAADLLEMFSSANESH